MQNNPPFYRKNRRLNFFIAADGGCASPQKCRARGFQTAFAVQSRAVSLPNAQPFAHGIHPILIAPAAPACSAVRPRRLRIFSFPQSFAFPFRLNLSVGI
ncbi:hypothetical protein LN386_27540, partial [Enterobacter hormaechei subsp. steigerwaltii]|nr:hypothetical protein [Enterobacter hormaechei subsp. steigerwaltii]